MKPEEALETLVSNALYSGDVGEIVECERVLKNFIDKQIPKEVETESDGWAKREVELAKAEDCSDIYGGRCYDSALKAYNSLLEDEHSGYSIMVTKQILNRLIDIKPLTPIEDTPDIWEKCARSDDQGYDTYQCKRMSSLFKDVYPDGTIRYSDTDRVSYHDRAHDSYWINKRYRDFVDIHYPINMPYYPSDEKFVFECETYGKEIGSYDIWADLCLRLPGGKVIELDMYWKETEDGDVRISREEFEELKKTRV